MDNHLYIYIEKAIMKCTHKLFLLKCSHGKYSNDFCAMWCYMALSTLVCRLLNACVLMSHLLGLQSILIAAFLVFYVPMLMGKVMVWHIKWATNYSWWGVILFEMLVRLRLLNLWDDRWKLKMTTTLILK